MTGERKYLEMIMDDVSKIIKCQEKMKNLNLEIEKILPKLYAHTIDFDNSGGCSGFRISVKGYLDFERELYDNIFDINSFNDLLNGWYSDCKILLGKMSE